MTAAVPGLESGFDHFLSCQGYDLLEQADVNGDSVRVAGRFSTCKLGEDDRTEIHTEMTHEAMITYHKSGYARWQMVSCFLRDTATHDRVLVTSSETCVRKSNSDFGKAYC